jgi:hypothetical protein
LCVVIRRCAIVYLRPGRLQLASRQALVHLRQIIIADFLSLLGLRWHAAGTI